MHVIREDEINPNQWQDWSLNDPTLQQRLQDFENNKALAKQTSGMLDWNSAINTPNGPKGNWTKGIWSHVFSETGWSSLILGKNARKRYTIVKPRYQYFITNLSKEDGRSTLRAKVPMSPSGKPGWVMTPHTPHTIRSTTRPCESCHESTLATGLGEPTLNFVEDGEPFLKELKRSNRILPQFQIKQMVSRNGWSLQNPMPKGKLQFLKSKEIKSLLKKSDRYRAYRYLDLRRAGHSRLLIRDEFPYDLEHQANKEMFGSPTNKETLYYYDLDQHRFFESQRPEPTPESTPAPDEMMEQQTTVEPTEEQENTTPTTPPQMPESPGPKFFIDLLPNVPQPTPAPQPLPEKGFLENETP
jgi:hypothetical protein